MSEFLEEGRRSRRQPREDLRGEQSKQQDQSVLRPSELGVSADKDRGTWQQQAGADDLMQHGHGEQYGFYSECNGKPLEGLEQTSDRIWFMP